jgi:sugar transferase (PEP-CTERM/EpsH1 system associated)
VRIRPYGFIRELALRGHDISLVCLVQPAKEGRFLSQVAPFCRSIYPVYPSRLDSVFSVLTSLPGNLPLSVAYCRSEPFLRLVQDLVERESFDLVHTEFIRAVPATSAISGTPKVYDAVDSLTLALERSMRAAQVSPLRRVIAFAEWIKMRNYETAVLDRYDSLIASSPVDQKVLEQNPLCQQVIVIPNGVDTDYFRLSAGERDPETILFLGKMSYYVNVSSVMWFYRKVLPIIRKERPKVKFQIVGRDPSRAIRALASDPNVEVTGTVPDVRPYLARATVNVCPMVSGAGIQNKMLEAMAVGLPTVATPISLQALGVEEGCEALVAPTEQEFAARVLELLADPELRQSLSTGGRLYVEANHSWETAGERLTGIYDSIGEVKWQMPQPSMPHSALPSDLSSHSPSYRPDAGRAT